MRGTDKLRIVIIVFLIFILGDIGMKITNYFLHEENSIGSRIYTYVSIAFKAICWTLLFLFVFDYIKLCGTCQIENNNTMDQKSNKTGRTLLTIGVIFLAVTTAMDIVVGVLLDTNLVNKDNIVVYVYDTISIFLKGISWTILFLILIQVIKECDQCQKILYPQTLQTYISN